MEKKQGWAAWLPDILAVAGGACVAAGAFLLYTALGFAVLGGLLIAAAVIVSKGGGAI